MPNTNNTLWAIVAVLLIVLLVLVILGERGVVR